MSHFLSITLPALSTKRPNETPFGDTPKAARSTSVNVLPPATGCRR